MRKKVRVGEKYNHLLVLKQVESHVTPSGSSFSKWRCLCDCGKEVDVLGTSLTSGHTLSCGCLNNRPKIADKVMLGKRFGRLTVVSRAPSHKIPSGSVYDMWNCVCDCGKQTVSFGRNLRNGHNLSCGCLRVEKQAEAKWTPKAEIWLKEYFDEHHITYDYQKTFSDLVGLNKGLLSYDFYVPDKNTLIELHGLQHYEPITWFGGENTYAIQTQHDALKREYANKNGYRLVEIPTSRITKSKLLKHIVDLGL